MGRFQFSGKRLQIDKNNSTILIMLSVASLVATFSLVATKGLLSQHGYQSRVINAKETAVDQLRANRDSVDSLVSSYQAFTKTSVNVLGGNPSGEGDRDGDNARIVLDALPSKYDFPALTTSLEKILTDSKFKIESIEGIDDELAQSKAQSGKPTVIPIPFQVGVGGSYTAMQDVLSLFQNSIRPFNITTLDFSGTDSEIHLAITASTYYQPEKTLTIEKKVIK